MLPIRQALVIDRSGPGERRRARRPGRLRALRPAIAGGVAAVALLVAGGSQSRPAAPSGATRIWARNIVMFPMDDAPATIVELSGTAVPTRLGDPIDMDHVASYAIRVRRAEALIPAATMAALMNHYILPRADTAMKRVGIAFGDGVILMRGTLQKGVPIGFEAQAVASVTPAGEMRITVTRMKAAGLVPKKVMDALGLTMAKVAQPDHRQVFRIVRDTMIMPVSSMFPPPEFIGPLRSVRVTPRGMFVVIGAGDADLPARLGRGPYLHLDGGRVKFARLTMAPTDLTMVPKARAALLGFSPAHYYRQLLGGYALSQADGGLVAHVADFRAFAPSPAAGAPR